LAYNNFFSIIFIGEMKEHLHDGFDVKNGLIIFISKQEVFTHGQQSNDQHKTMIR
jgi:hypothetical protein